MRENPSLVSIDALTGLSSIGGELQIIDNDALTSLDGLGSLLSAAEVNLTGNFSLQSVIGLS